LHDLERLLDAEVQALLEAADLGVDRFEGGRVEAFLVAEVVVDQLLVDARAIRDLVDARAGHALGRELVPGGGEYRLLGRAGIFLGLLAADSTCRRQGGLLACSYAGTSRLCSARGPRDTGPVRVGQCSARMGAGRSVGFNPLVDDS